MLRGRYETPTGYGQQTALFAPKLAEDYRLGISSFYGLSGNIIPWNGIPVFPALNENTHGNESILEHAKRFLEHPRGGLTVTLMDVWVLDPMVWNQLNLACWVPVDHEPAPGPVVDFLANSGAVPIAMAKFGQEQLRKAGLDPLYVPHGIDTEVYRPTDRAEAREWLGIDEDTFLVGMVAANKGNPSRKCFSEALQAFKALHAEHPEAKLYLHTEATGRFGGVHLPALIRSLDIDGDAIVFPDQYRVVHFPQPPESMAQAYSAMDVLLAPSAGEGFGIPVVEAQACGTPVIVSDFSAQPELVGAGWTVEGRKTYTPIGSWQFVPDVADILDALRRAYSCSGPQKAEESQKAVEFAADYDAERVYREHMLPALEEAESRYSEREPAPLAVAA